MNHECAICGKKPMSGNFIRHPHSGGWALRAPKKKRRFYPNLQTVHAEVKGSVQKLKVCVQCIKAGKVMRAAPSNYS